MDILKLERAYKTKRVLVTGAAGFIGSHLTELLVKLGADVSALVHYNSRSSIGWLEGSEFENDVNIVFGDVRDTFLCTNLYRNQEIVFNLAALIGIPYSYSAPSSYFETNLVGSINALEAMKENGEGILVQMSTSEVYGSAITTPMDEKHPLQPQSPYSASKISADAAAISYHASFGTQVVLARPFNTYGPRQSMRAIIPTIINQLMKECEIVDLGNVTPIRDFTYVSDTCRLLCKLAVDEGAIGNAINIGTGIGTSIEDLFKTICKIMSINKESRIDPGRKRPDSSEVDCLICDNSKLLSLTGSATEVSLEEGLGHTVEWFAANSDKTKNRKQRYFI